MPASTLKPIILRRWLCILEGVSFAWLLLLGHLAIYAMERMLICQINHGEFKESQIPAITRLILYLHPEELWSSLCGILMAGLGFGILSARSNEATHSRLFRWFIITMATALFAMVMPWIAIKTCLCGGPDDTWLDEVIFVLAGAILFVFAIRHGKQHH